ncbi:vacuolar protein sorting-associated protein VTA1 homolog [Ornithodoros turicata]|uniref:vacuolar protein sorting-associated protein VTA1 homolog n=1 Tax=Ornithodoros turicata TaxID=34597 RepID=UPI00313911D9
MAAARLPALPERLKSVAPYIKIANEHDKRDPVVAYWCRLYALQTGMKVDRSSSESRDFLVAYMDWLEQEKVANRDNEAIANDVVAQAHIENYALKLFLWADGEDRAARFNKNVVKAFYTAGYIFDVLATFGELTDEIVNHRKYAKWKAAYIHRCLRNGEQPVPGPMKGDDEGFEEDAGAVGGAGQSPANGPAQVPGTDFPVLPQGFYVPPGEPHAPPSTSSGSAWSGDAPSLTVPIPGAQAPPSTPSNASQLSPSLAAADLPAASNGVALQPEDFHRAQKYCKYAGSALQYEDIGTAIDNLQKALRLLTTGSE